ncbi:MAG: TIGR04552 family protein [Myxococcaceae bacterium]
MSSLLAASPQLPDLPLRPVKEWGLKELERVRLILRGGSVIEWRKLHFKTREEVDRFLRLCQIDPSRPWDEEWARTILSDSVEYLRKTFDYKVADPVANPERIHDLFLYASGAMEPKKYRKIACIVLKVMHVIQHIEGRDLMFKLAISEAEVAQLVSERVAQVVADFQAKSDVIIEFSDSIKTRESIITKLIAKRESVAAQIYDRTRFRIIVKHREDVLQVLYFLTQRLIPFNFVMPTQTENTLLNFKELLEQHDHLKKFEKQLHLDVDYEEREEHKRKSGNKFSGRGYRILNFVADVPIRLDSFLPPPERDERQRKGRIALALCEFQICDEVTAVANEQGENSHEEYKDRQRKVVLKRLSRGLVVPRRGEEK